ncbi:MAG TPA: HPr family phosphocarrier protein [Sporosarcina sp.]|nr:HPr family phosphocarrier protein [Sporosarcina sp.]
MVEKSVTVRIKPGLQARQAALFVQEANKYNADIFLKREGRQVNAKSIMGVMSLAISQGTEIVLAAEGNDEEQAIEALQHLVEAED